MFESFVGTSSAVDGHRLYQAANDQAAPSGELLVAKTN